MNPVYANITWRESSREGGGDRSFLLVGTPEGIANQVAETVKSSLTGWGRSPGPITITPISPLQVLKVGEE